MNTANALQVSREAIAKVVRTNIPRTLYENNQQYLYKYCNLRASILYLGDKSCEQKNGYQKQ